MRVRVRARMRVRVRVRVRVRARDRGALRRDGSGVRRHVVAVDERHDLREGDPRSIEALLDLLGDHDLGVLLLLLHLLRVDLRMQANADQCARNARLMH